MKPADQWTTAEATAAKAKPPVKFCLECDQPFTRLYRDVNGKPRLRELRRWSWGASYSSKACCAAYREAARAGSRICRSIYKLLSRPPGSPRLGRKPRKTGPEAIARAERTAAIMRLLFAGYTQRQIGLMMTPAVSQQAICKTVWKAMAELQRRDRARVEARAKTRQSR